MKLLAGLAEGFLELLYPALCWHCYAPLGERNQSFCGPCRQALTADDHAICPRCAATVGPYTAQEEGCTLCRDKGFAFERVVRLGVYQDPLRGLILRLKQSHQEGLAELVGRLWAETSHQKLQALNADLVVPVPLHWRRRLWRGFNQSDYLSAALAQKLNLPHRPRVLRRLRATPLQHNSPTERHANLRDAFRASTNLRGKTVLLVDDVLTTGGTAHEAARALKHVGARVVVAVLARAQGHRV